MLVHYYLLLFSLLLAYICFNLHRYSSIQSVGDSHIALVVPYPVLSIALGVRAARECGSFNFNVEQWIVSLTQLYAV